MKIKLLGAHNCDSQNTRFTAILIDDILALDAGGLTSSLPLPVQQQLKAVLLTHQHYDHTRDVPALAMNLYLAGSAINIYSTLPVCDVLTAHLFDGKLYPNFLVLPKDNPTIKMTVIEPLTTKQIEGYDVLAVPVNHSVATVGYQVTSSDGKVVFYTGDTGPGLTDCWKQVSPQLLITELTASNRFEKFGKESGHFVPNFLKQELITFKELKGYLPDVVTVHMSPNLEEEIKAEIAVVAKEIGCSIMPGYEGMELNL
jgi:ribonuclease BN (tRNA processing enzyme)